MGNLLSRRVTQVSNLTPRHILGPKDVRSSVSSPLSASFLVYLVRRSMPSDKWLTKKDLDSMKSYVTTSRQHDTNFKVKNHRRLFEREIKVKSEFMKFEEMSAKSRDYLKFVVRDMYTKQLLTSKVKKSVDGHLKGIEILSVKQDQKIVNHFPGPIRYVFRVVDRVRNFRTVKLNAGSLRKMPYMGNVPKGLDKAHIFSNSLVVHLWRLLMDEKLRIRPKQKSELKVLLAKKSNFTLDYEYVNRVVHVRQDREIEKAVTLAHRGTGNMIVLPNDTKARLREIQAVIPKLERESDSVKKFLRKSLKLLKKL